MSGAAPPVVVVVAAAAAAGAFGFAVYLAAKAPEVETAMIARPIRISFFMLSSPLIWKKDAPAVEHSKLECYALGNDMFPFTKGPPA